MRSLVGEVVNRITTTPGQAPVPYTGRRLGGLASVFGQAGLGGNREAQAAAIGGNGTLFAIAGGNASAIAGVKWRLYRAAASGLDDDRIEVTSHAALDVWAKPNPFMRRQYLVEVIQQHLELTGEGWPLMARSRLASWPVELWPVYPHRMTPVPSAETFLAGYVYTSPDGEQVPLDVADVRPILQPHPLDFLRGLGVVEAIGVDLQSAKSAAEWNRNFFLNSATPGGIIEFPTELQDEEFDRFRDRWREQHQGVQNAHRVAMIEMGAKWVDRSYSMRDMQFVELRAVSREAIREAYRYPVAMLGESKDVNRATAEAQLYIYARDILTPRLERWKDWLNHDFLPAFGATAAGLEFDCDSPMPEDEEAENAERDSKAAAARTYIESGWEPRSVQQALGLPAALVWSGRPDQPAQPAARAALRVDSWRTLTSGLVAPERRTPALAAAAEIPPELARVQADWEEALDQLLVDWQDLQVGQRDRLVDQVAAAVTAGDLAALAALAVLSGEQADLLAERMAALGTVAARRVAEEADDQGVEVAPVVLTAGTFAAAAGAAAALAAARLAASAGGEALRWAGYGRTTAEVEDAVRTHLDSLSDAPVRAQLGGALTWAQNAGRLETLRHAPTARYVAVETLDGNTCAPCRDIDGTELPTLEAMQLAYGGGGYLMCLGTIRCRGMARAVWGD